MSGTISLALCTWNGARFLPELLESLAAQRLAPDEIVVGDDESGDETVAIIERFAARSSVPVHVHVNAERLGADRQLLGDDRTLPRRVDRARPIRTTCGGHEKLASLRAAMERGAALAFADAIVVDDGRRPRSATRLWDGARRRQRGARSHR